MERGLAVLLTGQLTGAVSADRLDVLGLTETPITVERVLGVGLLIVGTFLVVR